MDEIPRRLRHLRSKIPDHKGSFALLSSAGASEIARAIVFVHGFNGAAASTWTDFLSLVGDDNAASRWWQNADLYFYHYRWNSVFQRIGQNSDQLFNFVNHIFPVPPDALFKVGSISLRPQFRYRELVLVGHSEGGLLLRKVVLEAANRDKRLDAYLRTKREDRVGEPAPEGLLLGQLRLFAPAIGGEALTGWIGLILNSSLVAPFLGMSSAKKGLETQSTPIRSAREYTDDWAEHFAMECFRAHILWAEHDLVVEPEKYKRDRHCTKSPPGTDHSSVCKPNRKYLRPLQFVEKGVEDGC
jgi:hypothetical protein